MCLLIASAILFGAYSFYMDGYILQAIISTLLASLLYGFFTYRMIKNRKCIFGDKADCNREANDRLRKKS